MQKSQEKIKLIELENALAIALKDFQKSRAKRDLIKLSNLCEEADKKRSLLFSAEEGKFESSAIAKLLCQSRTQISSFRKGYLKFDKSERKSLVDTFEDVDNEVNVLLRISSLSKQSLDQASAISSRLKSDTHIFESNIEMVL